MEKICKIGHKYSGDYCNSCYIEHRYTRCMYGMCNNRKEKGSQYCTYHTRQEAATMSEQGRISYYQHYPKSGTESYVHNQDTGIQKIREVCQTCGNSTRELVVPFGSSSTKVCVECMKSISDRVETEGRLTEDEISLINSPNVEYHSSYYKANEKDLYALFMEKYGLETWLQHVLMEAIQYLWRCLDKKNLAEDIEKVERICKRISDELKDKNK